MEGTHALPPDQGILCVENFLGHKKVENTLLYIQFAEVVYRETTDEFTGRVARSAEDIKQLLEVGFEYVCANEDLMFFRKRK